MRTVLFPVGTKYSTRYVVSGVIRVAAERQDRVWEGSHVTQDLWHQMHDRDIVVTREQLTYAMTWLTDRGYAIRTLNPSRSRHIRFELLEDVDLDVSKLDIAWSAYDYSDDARRTQYDSNGIRIRTAADRNRDRLSRGAAAAASIGKSEQPPVQLPLPLDHRPRHRWQELLMALHDWAEEDPESYRTWTDQVLSQLAGRNDEA